MSNKVRYGISNIVASFVDESSETGYGDIVSLPGAVNLDMSENGTSKTFYGDNGSYKELGSAGGKSGSIELAIFPDSFLAEAMGYRIDANGGLVEVAGSVKKPFALGYRVEGDEKARKCWMYNVTLTPPKDSHKTVEDTITPDTQTADFTAAPTDINGEPVVQYSLELTATNKAVYDAFFSKVTKPAADDA